MRRNRVIVGLVMVKLRGRRVRLLCDGKVIIDIGIVEVIIAVVVGIVIGIVCEGTCVRIEESGLACNRVRASFQCEFVGIGENPITRCSVKVGNPIDTSIILPIISIDF